MGKKMCKKNNMRKLCPACPPGGKTIYKISIKATTCNKCTQFFGFWTTKRRDGHPMDDYKTTRYQRCLEAGKDPNGK